MFPVIASDYLAFCELPWKAAAELLPRRSSPAGVTNPGLRNLRGCVMSLILAGRQGPPGSPGCFEGVLVRFQHNFYTVSRISPLQKSGHSQNSAVISEWTARCSLFHDAAIPKASSYHGGLRGTQRFRVSAQLMSVFKCTESKRDFSETAYPSINAWHVREAFIDIRQNSFSTTSLVNLQADPRDSIPGLANTCQLTI